MTILHLSILTSLSIIPVLHSMENTGRESFATKGNNEIVSYDNRGASQQSNYSSFSMIGTTNQGLVPHGALAVYTLPQRTAYNQSSSIRSAQTADQSGNSTTPLMSESSAEFARTNIERLKKIKNTLGSKGFFVTDDAAIYLSKKTANDSQQELDGFLEGISDELFQRKEITLNYALAREAVWTRRIFAEKFKSMGKHETDLGPVMQNFREQYRKDMKELKEMLEKNQQTNIKPYVYATLLSGATVGACGLVMYKMNNDHNMSLATLIEGNEHIIKMLGDEIQKNKKLIEDAGKTAAQSVWKTVGTAAATTAMVKGVEYVVENPQIIIEPVAKYCSIQ